MSMTPVVPHMTSKQHASEQVSPSQPPPATSNKTFIASIIAISLSSLCLIGGIFLWGSSVTDKASRHDAEIKAMIVSSSELKRDIIRSQDEIRKDVSNLHKSQDDNYRALTLIIKTK